MISLCVLWIDWVKIGRAVWQNLMRYRVFLQTIERNSRLWNRFGCHLRILVGSTLLLATTILALCRYLVVLYEFNGCSSKSRRRWFLLLLQAWVVFVPEIEDFRAAFYIFWDIIRPFDFIHTWEYQPSVTFIAWSWIPAALLFHIWWGPALFSARCHLIWATWLGRTISLAKILNILLRDLTRPIIMCLYSVLFTLGNPQEINRAPLELLRASAWRIARSTKSLDSIRDLKLSGLRHPLDLLILSSLPCIIILRKLQMLLQVHFLGCGVASISYLGLVTN